MIEGAANHAIKLCIRRWVWRLFPFEKSRPVAYILHLKKGGTTSDRWSKFEDSTWPLPANCRAVAHYLPESSGLGNYCD